jgi:hypothetical protein
MEVVGSLGRETLLNLLQMYESAISQLESRSEPRIAAFRERLQRRRTEVIAALAEAPSFVEQRR